MSNFIKQYIKNEKEPTENEKYLQTGLDVYNQLLTFRKEFTLAYEQNNTIAINCAKEKLPLIKKKAALFVNQKYKFDSKNATFVEQSNYEFLINELSLLNK